MDDNNARVKNLPPSEDLHAAGCSTTGDMFYLLSGYNGRKDNAIELQRPLSGT